jgi:hypothetical protein
MHRSAGNKPQLTILGVLLFLVLFITGCVNNEGSHNQQTLDRESKIPSDIVKVTPEIDVHPPQLYSDEWNEPVPLPSSINTAGAEDSAFILPDGNTLYFFFTPDVRVPVEKQVLDDVTGIYVAIMENGTWSSPKRVVLQDPGKLALDGAEFVLGNTMWFASAREGYTGVHWFTAEFLNGKWSNWKNADFNPAYNVGELHITINGTELYFHSERDGGKGGLDVWVSKKENNEWHEPENVAAVNTPGDEGWPFVNHGGTELWISREYGLWRSKKIAGQWTEPELIISPLAGECSLDASGNIYFTHHFYKDDTMIEADIYVAYRK